MDKLINNAIRIEKYLFKENGFFPNNPFLPLLIYKNAINEPFHKNGFKRIFNNHGWNNSWINGIYDYHHYHSTAHECLGIISGWAQVQFGGPEGKTFNLEPGDVVIIPAGLAHCCIEAINDFSCLGVYPDGQNFDINYGKENERPATDQTIQKLSLPKCDPVFGENGPLKTFWRIVEFDGV